MGFLMAGLGAIFAACKDLISKKLSFQLDGTLSTFASFAFALPFYVVAQTVLVWLGIETIPWTFAFWGYVALRALTDSFAEGLKMHALACAEISLVAMFFSLSPIFLLFFSPLLTNDPFDWPVAIAVMVSVAGSLVLVVKPGDRGWAEQRQGILLASGSALCFSLNSCFDRLAVSEGAPVVSAFAMTLLSAFMVFPFVAFRPASFQGLKQNQTGLWSRGLLEVVFMASKMSAMQFLPAPQVICIQRLSLLLSIVGGWLFFNERDFSRRFSAGLLILAGALMVIWSSVR